MSSRKLCRNAVLALFLGATFLPYAAEARSRDVASAARVEVSARTLLLGVVDLLRDLVKHGPPPPPPGPNSPEGSAGCPVGRPPGSPPPPGQRG